ncbi:response regulator [Dethiosulfatarculus sandiegensis]|uniref:Histidine kinase n=1 Tax=Dethiosulfatarculus sandiegensis TaxID=1429043 RepID=A0A0D2JBR5_9BACT|nr:response regulator [Dethiosulfatarculus sandiegensis]KIX15584.1 histidine kinase [Dethiosulfatarculus sandiegensis]
MAQYLDVIILDDDPIVCRVLKEIVTSFYDWGSVHTFTDFLEARTYCFERDTSVAIFILDVFLNDKSAFDFINEIKLHYPMAPQDTVVITGQASDDVVDLCITTGVNHLFEKPVRRYALQLAIRAIASKYISFAQKLMQDPDFAADVKRLESRD